MKTMKIKFFVLTSIVIGAIGFLVFYLSAVGASSLPSDLSLNVTFDYMKVSSDGSSWFTLFDTPATIDILAPTAQSTTGKSITITPPSVGTYQYLRMKVSAIYFSQPGKSNRDILSILKRQGGGEDFSDIIMNILPFTYATGDPLSLNIYMPPENISGSSFDTYFPENGPVFGFTGGSTAASGFGTINVSIASGIAANAYVHAGAFRQVEKDAGPSQVAQLTNAGNGSASGTLLVPPGTWYAMAIETTEQITAGGPGEGTKVYSLNGAKPWEGNLTPVTVAAGQTQSVSLSYAFTITSTMGAGGGGRAPTGNSSLSFTIAASGSAISLTSAAELMLYAFTSEAQTQQQSGGPPNYFLGSKSISAGSLSSTTMTASSLAAGTYVVVAFLDVDGNGSPTIGTDYFGFYGGQPTAISLGASETKNLTGSPIYLTIVTQ